MNEENEAKWYVLHTFTGYEMLAKENLEQVIENGNLQNRIFEVVVPMEDVMEEKKGKRVIVKRKMMPSYLLIKMIYGDDLWHTITSTRGVTGFVGPKGRPLPMTDDEIRRLHLEKVVIDFVLNPGEVVEIVDGPLMGNAATIISVDASNEKCQVNVNLFGRETKADISYSQIKKIN